MAAGAVSPSLFHKTYRLIEPLLKAGADINQENDQGLTPLFLVFEQLKYEGFPSDKKLRLVRKMLELGADIHHVSRNNMNALWAATGCGSDLVDFVRSQGIVDKPVPDKYYEGMDRHGQIWSSIFKHDMTTFQRFVDAGAVNLASSFSIMERAIYAGNLAIVKMQIEAGFPARRKDQDGRRPHEIAREYGELVQLFPTNWLCSIRF